MLFSPAAPTRAAAADGGEAARQALAAAISRLLRRLVDNLEAKSRSYRGEPALSALFMMNNVHYVQWSVEGSPAEGLLGREWLEKHKDQVEDWGAKYQEVTWGPVLALLQVEPPSDVGRLKQHLKETFSSFNAAVERVYVAQSAWTIPDAALRDAVRRVVKGDLLPPYQDFLRRYAEVNFSATPAKYIKYTAGDVQAIVDDDLFEAKVGRGHWGEAACLCRARLLFAPLLAGSDNPSLDLKLLLPSPHRPQFLPSTKLDLKQQKMAAIM